ncbi:MAG: hypothetical protein V3G42_07480 [Oscillospiraceae bacterium]
MRQQKNIVLLLVGCLLVSAFVGCSKKQTNDSSESLPVENEVSDVDSDVDSETEIIPIEEEKQSSGDKKMVITIDTVEISEEELKAQDYTVPVSVTLEKNAGITYSEWGLSYDDRCEVKASTTRLEYNTVYAFSEDKPFLWTAWSGGAQVFEYESPVLNLSVRLPEDAMVGDFYPIKYESISQANSPHKWSDGTNDWVAMDAVSWNDGGVKVVVSAD